MNYLKVKKLRENAIIPKRATKGSAGIDLYACLEAELTVPARGHAFIPTGIAIALPDSSLVAMVFARSGLAIKHGIGLLNGVGVVDSDYRGEVCVGVCNQFDEEYTIQPGERIAQIVIMPVSCLPVVETENLEETERGEGGFGSTGQK
ncbi:MAG TPA: dUTP diphosphatase [Clostridia bacterium]|nr:dUTP diphosphatase [Clostridia bacterium]